MTEQERLLNYATISGQGTLARDIVGVRRTGWCTAYRGPESSFGLAILKWKPGTPAIFLPLDWAFRFINISICFQGIVAGRYIVGGWGGNNLDRIGIAEFDQVTGALLYETQYGDETSRWGAATALSNGGMAGITYCEAPEHITRFDAFYRQPDVLTPPGGTAPPLWQIQRYEFPNPEGSVAQRYSMSAVQGQDGLVYVFYTRDSSQTIGLVRFAITEQGMTLVDFNDQLIPDQSSETPSGEFPNVTAAVDPYHGGIVLAYQNSDLLRTTCPGLLFAAHWILVRVNYDRTFRRIGILDSSWTAHQGLATPAIYPRPDGIYWALDYQNVRTTELPAGDCALHWNVGMFKDGNFTTMASPGWYSIRALSRDGMIAAYTVDPQETELVELIFPPAMTARRFGNNIRLDWDKASPTDVLERSANLKTWIPAGYSGLPPATVLMDQPQQFFRVKVQ